MEGPCRHSGDVLNGARATAAVIFGPFVWQSVSLPLSFSLFLSFPLLVCPSARLEMDLGLERGTPRCFFWLVPTAASSNLRFPRHVSRTDLLIQRTYGSSCLGDGGRDEYRRQRHLRRYTSSFVSASSFRILRHFGTHEKESPVLRVRNIRNISEKKYEQNCTILAFDEQCRNI